MSAQNQPQAAADVPAAEPSAARRTWLVAVPVAVFAALAAIGLSLPAVPPPSVAELSDVAFGYFHANKRELAMETIQTALALAPDAFESNYIAGLLAYTEGRYPEAVSHLERAAAARPEAMHAHLTLGAVYQRMQAYDKAIASYRMVERRDPNHAAVHYNLGMLERSRGNAAEARRYLQRYLVLAPTAADRAEVENALRELSAPQARP